MTLECTTTRMATEAAAWEHLLPEALAEIFARLPFEERFVTVPLVCKSWMRACTEEPACWRSVDMEAWFLKRVEEDHWWEFECDDKIKWIINKVVDRSRGLLQEIRTMHCCDSALDYIAERCPRLLSLGIRNSLWVTDASASKVASMCPRLQYLDLSDCYNISSSALEAFGRNCRELVHVKRNMLRNADYVQGPDNLPHGDDEALCVSRFMHQIRHLEMKRSALSDQGLLHIARGCRSLEYLDVSLCVKLSAKGLESAASELKSLKIFIKPILPASYTFPDLLWMFFE